MTQTWVTRIAFALTVALMAASNVKSQASKEIGVQQGIDERSKAETAKIVEAIIVREEAASGRAFDQAYRAQVKADLAAHSPEELAAVEKRGFGLVPSPNVLGSTAVDLVSPNVLSIASTNLVFNPVAPCRIIDTRMAGGPIAAGSQRNFLATGNNYGGQGGFAGSCGIPFGPATAVVVNFVAVGPPSFGDLRAFPFGATVPLASVLNYIPQQNVANGIVLAICDPSASTCGFDFTVQADANLTDLVADVMGYYSAVKTFTASNFVTPTASITGSCSNAGGQSVAVTTSVAGTVNLSGWLILRMSHVTGTEDEVDLDFGTTAGACSQLAGFTVIPPEFPTSTANFPIVPLSGSFAVGAGTTTTFFLNMTGFGNVGVGNFVHFDSRLTATFIPNR